MPLCLKRIQPMPNVPLAYVSVYQRMSDIFHTLAYASTIRYSVTGPLHPSLHPLTHLLNCQDFSLSLVLIFLSFVKPPFPLPLVLHFALTWKQSLQTFWEILAISFWHDTQLSSRHLLT